MRSRRLVALLACGLACSQPDASERPPPASAPAALPSAAPSEPVKTARVGWFRAEDAETDPQRGVIRWPSRAGGELALVQPDPTRRPLQVSEAPSFVSCDGKGQGLYSDTPLSLRGDAEFTVLMVTRLPATPEIRYPVVWALGAPDVAAGGFGLMTPSEGLRVFTGHHFDVELSEDPPTLDALSLVTVRKSPGAAGDSTHMRLNGRPLATVGAAADLNLQPGPFWLGTWGSQPARADMFELLIYDQALSSDDLRSVECYLALRHQLPLAGGRDCAP